MTSYKEVRIPGELLMPLSLGIAVVGSFGLSLAASDIAAQAVSNELAAEWQIITNAEHQYLEDLPASAACKAVINDKLQTTINPSEILDVASNTKVCSRDIENITIKTFQFHDGILQAEQHITALNDTARNNAIPFILGGTLLCMALGLGVTHNPWVRFDTGDFYYRVRRGKNAGSKPPTVDTIIPPTIEAGTVSATTYDNYSPPSKEYVADPQNEIR